MMDLIWSLDGHTVIAGLDRIIHFKIKSWMDEERQEHFYVYALTDLHIGYYSQTEGVLLKDCVNLQEAQRFIRELIV